eukprot:PhM_4_TR9403/c0_g1_i1/m.107149
MALNYLNHRKSSNTSSPLPLQVAAAIQRCRTEAFDLAVHISDVKAHADTIVSQRTMGRTVAPLAFSDHLHKASVCLEQLRDTETEIECRARAYQAETADALPSEAWVWLRRMFPPMHHYAALFEARGYESLYAICLLDTVDALVGDAGVWCRDDAEFIVARVPDLRREIGFDERTAEAAAVSVDEVGVLSWLDALPVPGGLGRYAELMLRAGCTAEIFLVNAVIPDDVVDRQTPLQLQQHQPTLLRGHAAVLKHILRVRMVSQMATTTTYLNWDATAHSTDTRLWLRGVHEHLEAYAAMLLLCGYDNPLRMCSEMRTAEDVDAVLFDICPAHRRLLLMCLHALHEVFVDL